MATLVYPVCEIVRNMVAALLRRSEHLLERAQSCYCTCSSWHWCRTAYKWTKWLISVYISVTVSLLTVYWWSANGTLGLWLPWSGRLLMVNRWSIVSIVKIYLDHQYPCWTRVMLHAVPSVLQCYNDTPPAWVTVIRIGHILGNGTANPGVVCTSFTKHQ